MATVHLTHTPVMLFWLYVVSSYLSARCFIYKTQEFLEVENYIHILYLCNFRAMHSLLYQSSSWQEANSTLKLGTWGQFNKWAITKAQSRFSKSNGEWCGVPGLITTRLRGKQREGMLMKTQRKG